MVQEYQNSVPRLTQDDLPIKVRLKKGNTSLPQGSKQLKFGQKRVRGSLIPPSQSECHICIFTYVTESFLGLCNPPQLWTVIVRVK